MAATIISNYAAAEMRHGVDYIIATVERLKEHVAVVDDWSLPAALDALAHAKKARRVVKGFEQILTDLGIAEMLHAGETTYEGNGYTATLRDGTSAKAWNHLAVVDALIENTVQRRCSQHPDIDPAAIEKIVRADFATAYGAAAPSWRRGVLRRLGIDPDDHSQRVQGAQSIEMRGPATYDPTNPRFNDDDVPSDELIEIAT